MGAVLVAMATSALWCAVLARSGRRGYAKYGEGYRDLPPGKYRADIRFREAYFRVCLASGSLAVLIALGWLVSHAF